MKLLRSLLLLMLTLVWLGFLLSSINTSQSILIAINSTLVYVLLVYLVWPIGTQNFQSIWKRFHIVLGAGTFFIAADIFLLANECPSFPSFTTPISGAHHASGLTALLMVSCFYLGSIFASLIMAALGFCLIYKGFSTRMPESLRTQPSISKT